MSHWNIAAAQYVPRHNCTGVHVKHHLRFIHAAARHNCDLLVFPELSLTGCAMDAAPLPEPPAEEALFPLMQAVQTSGMTVIAGTTIPTRTGREKGLLLFNPENDRPEHYLQGSGACLKPDAARLSILGHPADVCLDPQAALFTSPQSVTETRWRDTISSLQHFAHRYAIAVLMANARGGSALWDDQGQLVVRADKGELLLTGYRDRRGWQGDIIPLR
ncbi:carbon-nitrogen hydrolase family protein [Pseudenterobacter timonensis]|uniref:Carbon-nitrogen hydrolase family protein n=1 Tax=Pseudenterobacter timonensis TaxID=1755099 RepID=A0AAE4IYL0_9ENTR|nr:carbon-nitrogen hydrolase family protein [Pseudenterobacter timonensis]MDR9892361.1 carbon-nitrogen hydrolase family protein [Pseudenterobacter timonensis]